MNTPAQDQQSQSYQLVSKEEGEYTLFLRDRIEAYQAGSLIKELRQQLKNKHIHSLDIDLAELEFMDDYGILVLSELRDLISKIGGNFNLRNPNQKTQQVLSLYNLESVGQKDLLAKQPLPSIFTRLGESSIKHMAELRYMVSFVGSVCLSFLYVLRHPKSLRWNDTLFCMQRIGVDALPIVGLISFLLGLIMAFMSSFQLQQFGANIYVANLVSLSMTRELGPIMTAILVAGRSGSSFAAEVGTMQISDEVDALFTMGFDPTRFLVLPKLIAATIVVPFLVLFSDIFAIMGGLIVGVFMLDLTANAYITQTINSLSLFDVFLGFFKGILFAALITWIGCFRGFRVKGGAAAVGQATTSAVVSSIFLIIVTDSVFAVIIQYWG
jgi:phospholipid/cholesterol/gamma-HCH transport system permease protein